MKREHDSDEAIETDGGDRDDAHVGEGVIAEGEDIAKDIAERPPAENEDDTEQRHVHGAHQEVRDCQTEDEVVVVSSKRPRCEECDDHKEVA